MSYWTHINGIIKVMPFGDTQHQKIYILETVLDHLPRVTGSENDMRVHVIQGAGFDSYVSHNEFGELITGNSAKKRGRMQSKYYILVEAALRDRTFDNTFLEFNNWLNRLAKRIYIEDVLIRISGHEGRGRQYKQFLYMDPDPYAKMFESPSWCNNSGEPSWSEYLMWDTAKGTRYPMKLYYKYFKDLENDEEYERRYHSKPVD